MNVKRYLKKQAKQDRLAIMEADGGETLRALGIEPPKKKPHRAAWIAGAASLAASLAVVLTCVFTLYPFNAQEEKYLEENFVTEDSTVEKMNAELHDFLLTFDETACQIAITRTYDSVSGEALYYQLTINRSDNSLYGEFYITCNEHYEYPNFTFSLTPIFETLTHYAITYQLESTIHPQYGFETITCKAEIKGTIDCVYITQYDELILDGHTFLDSVQAIVHATEN